MEQPENAPLEGSAFGDLLVPVRRGVVPFAVPRISGPSRSEGSFQHLRGRRLYGDSYVFLPRLQRLYVRPQPGEKPGFFAVYLAVLRGGPHLRCIFVFNGRVRQSDCLPRTPRRSASDRHSLVERREQALLQFLSAEEDASRLSEQSR